MNMHLTDDQIDDYLIGDLSDDAAAHLAACEPCTLRVAKAEAPIASFKAVSLAWSERQSATLPTQPVARPSNWSHRFAWATAMTAVLTLAITVPVLRHGGRSDDHVAVTQAPAMVMASTGRISELTREQEIDHDNQMLRDIENELTAPSDAPSLLQPTGVHPHSHMHGTAIQD